MRAAKATITKELVNRACGGTPWDVGNKVLYEMCRQYPAHKDVGEIVGKIWLIGRAYAYGLGAGGEAGVTRAIDILRADVIRTMKLLGCAAIKDLDGSFVDIPSQWTARL